MKLNVLLFTTVGIGVSGCANTFSGLTGIGSQGANLTSSSFTGGSQSVTAATPATQDQAFSAINSAQAKLTPLTTSSGISLAMLAPNDSEGESDTSQAYGGSDSGNSSGDPAVLASKFGASSSGTSDPIAQAEQSLIAQIDNASASLQSLSSSQKSSIQQACASAVQQLQSLNLTNLSAQDQELVQANIAVLEEIEAQI